MGDTEWIWHGNWTEKSQIILVFVLALCCFIRLFPFFVIDSFFLCFSFCFPGPAVSIMDFTVGSTKLRLPLPLPFSVLVKTAFFGRGVPGNKISTRCCCIFFHDCRQIVGGILKCLTCCSKGLPVILNSKNIQ